MLKNLNLPAIAALVVYPLILIGLLISYSLDYGLGWKEFGIAVIGYYVSNITVGIGLHRLWSHNSYKTNKAVEFVLAVLSAGTLQGPVLSWASNHYKHHTFTDKDMDPHSPLKYKNRFLGFLWSHIGWMLVGEGSYKSIDRLTMVKLGRNPVLRFQLKYYWQLALFVNLILPAAIGYLAGGTLLSAYASFLFVGIGRALQQQATFCVNSLCHFMGTKKYYKGTAGDIWWMALFLLGENWHNFHHAFPSDYRNGFKWYHFDVHKWIIYGMSKIGLASDLEITPKVRIEAKEMDTGSYFLEKRKNNFELLKEKIENLRSTAMAKINELENSPLEPIKKKFLKSLARLQEKASKLASQMGGSSINLKEKSCEKLLKTWNGRIFKIERSFAELYERIGKTKSFS